MIQTPKIITLPYTWNPNRERGFKVKGFVIHSMLKYIKYDKNKPALYAPEYLKDIEKTSAHGFIESNGNIFLGQPFTKVAYHAGVSKWKEYDKLNTNFLGFELLIDGEGDYNTLIQKMKDPSSYTEEHYNSLAFIIKKVMETEGFTKEYICRHSDCSGQDVRPDNPKYDPGTGFDFQKLLNLI